MNPRILLFVGSLSLVSCSATPEEQQRTAFTAAVKSAGSPLLFEGLPHQGCERDLFNRELASKKVVVLDGFHFYEKPLSLSELDEKSLSALLCDRRCHIPRPVNAVKACGGFHPDFCLEWHKGEDTYRVQICFGCSEAQTIGPELKVLWDMDDNYRKQIVDILRLYRLNRPPFGKGLLHPW